MHPRRLTPPRAQGRLTRSRWNTHRKTGLQGSVHELPLPCKQFCYLRCEGLKPQPDLLHDGLSVRMSAVGRDLLLQVRHNRLSDPLDTLAALRSHLLHRSLIAPHSAQPSPCLRSPTVPTLHPQRRSIPSRLIRKTTLTCCVHPLSYALLRIHFWGQNMVETVTFTPPVRNR